MRINTEWRRFGEGFELRLFPVIRKNFGEDLVRTKTWEKFDYNIYNEAYFAEKYPGFDSSVHKILADCSKKKIEEHRDGIVKKSKGDFIVRFD